MLDPRLKQAAALMRNALELLDAVLDEEPEPASEDEDPTPVAEAWGLLEQAIEVLPFLGD